MYLLNIKVSFNHRIIFSVTTKKKLDIRNRKHKCSSTFPSLGEHVSVVIHIKQVVLVIKPIQSIINGYENMGAITFAFILPQSIIQTSINTYWQSISTLYKMTDIIMIRNICQRLTIYVPFVIAIMFVLKWHLMRLSSDLSCSKINMKYNIINAGTVLHCDRKQSSKCNFVFPWSSCHPILLVFLYEIVLTPSWIGCSEHLWCLKLKRCPCKYL